MTRKRRRRLLTAILLLAALGLALARFPFWTRGLVAEALSSFFERPATVGAVQFRFFPFEIEVRDIRVGGAAPEAPPFLEVPRLVAVPLIRPLWDRRARFTRLQIYGVKLRVNAYREGGDDIPKIKAGGGPGTEVRIGRLTIQDGQVLVDHQRVPLNLDLPGFKGRLLGRRAGALGGEIAFGPGPIRIGANPPLPVSAELGVILEGRLLTVLQGRLRAEKIDLAVTGTLEIQSRPQGRFALQGPADLAVLDRHLIHSGLGLKGDARYDGELTVDGSRLRLQGRFAGTQGEFDGVAVPTFASQIAWSEKGVRLQGLELTALGGSGTIDLEIPPGAGSLVHLTASMKEVDADGLVRAVFDLGETGVGAAATGPLELRWPKGRTRHLTGTLGVDLAAKEDGRTPLLGRFDWRAEEGLQTVVGGDLRTPTTQLRLRGQIHEDRRVDLLVDGESRDLAAADVLGRRLRQSLGTAEAQLAGISGAGGFRGHWGGTLELPVFEGRFTGQEVGYLGVNWGRAEWAGVMTPTEIRSHSLVVRRPGGELWLDGRLETGFLGDQDAAQVKVRIKDWPAEDFTKALAWELDAQGLVSGEAEIQGRRSAPRGTVRISGREGRYYGIPYRNLELRSALRGSVTEVTLGRAGVGGGEVSFLGTATDEGIYDGSVQIRDVDLGDVLVPLAPEVPWGGKVSGSFVMQGPLERPRIEGQLSSQRLFLGDEGLGELFASLRGTGDGKLALEASCRSPRVALALTGNLRADPPYRASLRLSADNTSLDPFLRLLAPRVPTSLGVLATGQASIEGPLLEPTNLAVDAEISGLELLLPSFPIKNPVPLRLALRHGRLDFQEVRFAGEGTALELSGRAALLEAGGPLDLKLQGSTDLRALGLLSPNLRGRGGARVSVAVAGTRGAPTIDGRLEIDGGAIRWRGFPHGIEEIKGSLRFGETAAELAGVTATVAGGSVEMEGQATYPGGRPGSFDLKASGRGMSLRYPDGLRSRVDAELRLFGDQARQWLTGRVDVREAVWTRRYDLASELLAESRPREESASLAGGLRNDIKVVAPGTVRIDNNLAALQARAEVALQGTDQAPVIVGRAEIERGRLYFQGNTYTIKRGTLDFANPRRTDPLFDIEAETRIQSYRITLKINGTLDRVYPTLSADPYLTSVQILSLLAGADESTVASYETGPLRDAAQTRLAAAGAATLATGKVFEEVGLEKGAARLGLSRFSIDPSLVRGNTSNPNSTNPTARLTVGKRVTNDLNVLYSVDLRGTEEKLFSVEYTLKQGFSLLLTRAEPGGFGFDVSFRRSR
ncbi:MAG TPA: translocation/assembly module TamB domain-containing protein [Vicinamibacteria bacterium]|nr:translocation/assembly module TamB domain-containing protein [Vicinamibacteria bacterium]